MGGRSHVQHRHEIGELLRCHPRSFGSPVADIVGTNGSAGHCSGLMYMCHLIYIYIYVCVCVRVFFEMWFWYMLILSGVDGHEW